jgi:hypothetical protein
MGTYGWIEQSATDSEEHPYCYHKTEAEYQTNVQQNTGVGGLCQAVGFLACG